MTEISAPREWFAALDLLEKEKGIAVLLGGTDTGKSTLAKFLVTHLCRRGLRVALVDADIGQSFLGAPTTIGLSLFQSHPDWDLVLSPPEIFFVGSTTPEGNFPVHLKGVKRMLDKASARGAEVILVDTTGFVSGEGGKELKRRKIDLLSPRFIFALQREGELESILEPYRDQPCLTIVRLPISDGVRIRSMEERRAYRTKKFEQYFQSSTIQELSVDGLRIEGEVLDPTGAPIPLEWSLQINGLLIGLKDGEGDTLALGLIRNYVEDERRLRVLTPCQDIQKVKTIQLSSQKVVPHFEA